MHEEQMHKTREGAGDRSSSIYFECFGLAVAVLLVLQLAFAYHACEQAENLLADSWHEKDWRMWFQAQQLYRRSPEELSRVEFDNARRWCDCLTLIAQHETSGNASLTDDECQFVVDALDDLCPSLSQHSGYMPIYQACRRRLQSNGRPLA